MKDIDIILDIQVRIRGGGGGGGPFNNEASVSLGIILRLLDKLLGWPIFETDVVSPEYFLEGTRVDYALCHPRNKPIVFIEVKQLGKIEGADRQLFRYAFHKGVPIAILSDGREWHFYLPGGQGDYEERRVYKLDLLERDPEESVYRLKRYLDYKAICSGEAIKNAKEDYDDVDAVRKWKETLPEAWKKLTGDKDEKLIELMANKVESLCGRRPEASVVLSLVLSFLTELKPRQNEIISTKHKPKLEVEKGKKGVSTDETRIEISLSNADVKIKHVTIPTKYLDRFPPKTVSKRHDKHIFTVIADGEEYRTHIEGGNRLPGIRRFFHKHPELKKGDILYIDIIEPKKRYKLSVMPSEN